MRHYITALLTKKALDNIDEDMDKQSKKSKKSKVLTIDASSIRNVFLRLAGIDFLIYLTLLIFFGGIGDDLVGDIIVFAFMVGIPLIAAFFFYLFYIKFDKEEIIYRNYIGIVKHIKYSDITRVLKNDYNRLDFYLGEKKVLSIDEMFTAFPIEKTLNKYNITIKESNTLDNFIIKNIPAIKYIFLFIFVLSFILTIIGVVALFNDPIKDVIELIKYLLLIFSLPVLFLLLYIYFDKKRYIIVDGKITYRSLFKKDLVLDLKDIVYYKVEKKSNNVHPMFVFYAKSGKSMSILNNPVGYTNIYLLKKLIKEYNWEKKQD